MGAVRALALWVPLVAAIAGAAGCTFIDINFDGGNGGAASTSSSSSTADVSTSSLASTTEAPATTGLAGTSGLSTSAGMTCDDCIHSAVCDCDHDGVDRFDVDTNCYGVDNDPAKSDCDDCNDVVFPGQGGWYTVGIDGTQNFDYDCSGTISYQYSDTMCPALALGCTMDAQGNINKATTASPLSCGGQVTTQDCSVDCGGLLNCCPGGNPTTIAAGNGCH